MLADVLSQVSPLKIHADHLRVKAFGHKPGKIAGRAPDLDHRKLAHRPSDVGSAKPGFHHPPRPRGIGSHFGIGYLHWFIVTSRGSWFVRPVVRHPAASSNPHRAIGASGTVLFV